MRTFAQICGGTRTDKTSKHSYDTQYVKYFESLDVSRVDASSVQRPYWTWVAKQSGQLN